VKATSIRAFLCCLVATVLAASAGADDSPSMAAVKSADVERVRTLLEEGADPNETDPQNTTLLHHAGWKGNAEIIALLLEHGADKSFSVRERAYVSTPLDWIALKGDAKVVKLFLDAGCPVYDSVWETVRRLAKDGPPPWLDDGKKENYEEILAIFEKAGFEERTDIFSACKRGKVKRVRALIAETPDLLETRTPEGDEFGEGLTPLLFASGLGNRELLEVLIAAGANVEAKDRSGNSVIHIAAGAGAWQNVLRLIEAGADVNAKNKNGLTPIQLAVAGDRRLTVELLLTKGAEWPGKIPRETKDSLASFAGPPIQLEPSPVEATAHVEP
jgi:ankyrin repeat protein